MRARDYLTATGIADLTLDNAIRVHVRMVLAYCGGNRQWAAEELGINPSTLYRWAHGEGRAVLTPRVSALPFTACDGSPS